MAVADYGAAHKKDAPFLLALASQAREAQWYR
jgi:hypothetical protein